jgi:Divergent InlB B-repeat domain/PKD domain
MDGLGSLGTGRRAQARAGARLARLLAVIGAVSLAAAALAAPAGAETFGQIGAAWGTPGSGSGQLFNPAMLGVDSSDGSVYSGEEMPDGKHFRIQKFSSAGVFKAKVELPLILKEGGEEKVLTLHGIAVDPVLHRLYLIEGCAMVRPADTCEAPPNIEFGAKRILVFSTEPKGSELVPAEVPTLKLPEGEDTLYTPESIAVDPSSHDLVVLGENIEERATVQRIGSAGSIGARFVDTGNELRPVGKEATSIAVGPDGTTYTLTGSSSSIGSKSTRAWQLPKDLSHAEKVPGFAEAAEAEGWATGLLSQTPSPLVGGGTQLAVSPDGGTLYWKESLGQAEEEDEPDNVLIRGYSLEKKATQVLYGNGEASCLIQTSEAGIGAVGKNLIVFDYGPEFEEGKLPAYGDHVLTFGSGGSGCRAPVAKFTVNGSSESEVEVTKGAIVTFDASGSEMLGTTPTELDWNFGDGTEEKVVEKLEVPPKTTITHKFLSGGTYTVTLKMKLAPPSKGATGNPLPVTHAVKVPGSGTMQKLTVAKTGTGSGTVIGSPAGIGCGSDCEQEYEEGKEVTLTATAATGSKFIGWSLGSCPGATPCKVTMSAAKEVKANFDAKPQFKLTVSKTGTGTGAVTSSPSGIDCRKDCAQEYEEGKVVTLIAHLDKESELAGWTGCQSESEDKKCSVTMSAAKEVKANLVSTSTPKFELAVAVKTGTGTGTVTSTSPPGGINCGVDCTEKYSEGTVVTLSQKPASDSNFKGWTGCESEPAGECKVTMSAAREVKAKFDLKPKFKLTVEKTGIGTGTVTSSTGGISCGVDCEEEDTEGTVVTLSQKSSPDSNFKGWTGCESEPEGKCKVTMSAAKEVKAKYELKPKFKLTVTKSGTGSGTVTSSPSGINCGGDCEEEYPEGEVIALTPTPSSGSKFVAWTGACTGAGACNVTMSAAKAVNAEFATVPPPPPTEEKQPLPEVKPPPAEEKPPTKKLTPKQKALAKCRKLKGKARAKCIKKANAIGRHKKPHHRRSLRGRG